MSEHPESQAGSWPNLFIPSAPKSGTSSLYRYFQGHPDIFMSVPKEPMFFLEDAPTREQEAAYIALFEQSGGAKFRGDGSNRYGAHPTAYVRIAERTKDPKFIFLLRNPIDRAWSHYTWARALGHETLPLLEAMQSEPSLAQTYGGARLGMFRNYERESTYAPIVARFVGHFGRTAVLVLVMEDLLAEPAKVLQECASFLGIAPFEGGTVVHANRTPHESAGRLFALLTMSEHSDPVVQRLQRITGPLAIRMGRSRRLVALRDGLVKKITPPRSEMSVEDRALLREMFRQDVAELRDLTGCRFAPWARDFPSEEVHES